MVELRKPSSLFPADTRWKVTARYTVQVSPRKNLDCVRVHGYFGNGYTLHLSEAEFKRLFKKEHARSKR